MLYSLNHIIISEYISIILRLGIMVNQNNMDISVYLYNYSFLVCSDLPFPKQNRYDQEKRFK